MNISLLPPKFCFKRHSKVLFSSDYTNDILFSSCSDQLLKVRVPVVIHGVMSYVNPDEGGGGGGGGVKLP